MKRNLLISILFLLVMLIFFIVFSLIKNDTNSTKNYEFDCEFIRTYNVYAVYESNDNAYLYITIRGFQNEDIQTIKISKNVSKELIPGKNYEFKFKQNDIIPEDNILNIYNNCDLISIDMTDAVGLDQINENYCN